MAAAALAPADVSALAGAKVAPVATAAVDELVPVRVMSSLAPDSLGAMIPQPRDWGNSERAGCVGAGRRYFGSPRHQTRMGGGYGAAAQLELADAAIAIIVGCSNLVNEAALATIGPK
jgi:hypothetical protein